MIKQISYNLTWMVLILTLAFSAVGSGKNIDHSEQELWPEIVFEKAIEFNQVTIDGMTVTKSGEADYRIQYWTGNHWRNIETDYSSQRSNSHQFYPVVSRKVRLVLNDECQASTVPTFTVHNNPRGMEESGFESPERNPRLPDVLLFGDSITQQYAPYVESNLAGVANVYRLAPRHDCDSKNFIPAIKQLKQLLGPEIKWDIIHFNFGLHDMKRYNLEGKKDRMNGIPQVELKAYAENLQYSLDWLSENYPRTKLIFATTTPVPEGEPRRRSADSMRYNKIARKVLSGHPEATIHDLFTYTLPHHEKWQIALGNVHFNETGKRAQGSLVADAIRKSLNQ